MFHVKQSEDLKPSDVSRETIFGKFHPDVSGTEEGDMFHVKHSQTSTSCPQAGPIIYTSPQGFRAGEIITWLTQRSQDQTA